VTSSRSGFATISSAKNDLEWYGKQSTILGLAKDEYNDKNNFPPARCMPSKAAACMASTFFYRRDVMVNSIFFLVFFFTHLYVMTSQPETWIEAGQ